MAFYSRWLLMAVFLPTLAQEINQEFMTQGLFRKEAMEQHTDRLHGDILLLPRFSHSLLITLLLLWLFAVGTWLMTSSYSRKETVAGWLEPPAGIIRVYAEDAGIIKQVLVAEGDMVIAGQPLIIVNGDRTLANGDNLENQLLQEYQSQQGLINEQLSRTRDIYQRREQDIKQRIVAAEQDLALLGKQLVTLNERHELVQSQVESYRHLKREGHVSLLEFHQVLVQELTLRSDQQALLREQVNRRNQIQQLHTEQELLPQENANVIDQLRTQLSDIAQQVSQLYGQRAYIIEAPRAGTVHNLQARAGQQARNGSSVPLLTLMPVDAELTVRLLIPVRSAGFIAQSQPLDIRYDAFPYQKFGLYRGDVISISKTILLPDEILNAPIRVQEPVYQVTANLLQPHVHAYGQDFPLKAGMTLSADVRLSERSLLQWLLEPIYSLKGRL